MAQVSLQINGYGYILGCADGEEEHLRALAADLDRRIDEMKASTGPTGEARMLLMAALMLSDELHDLRGQREDDPPATPKPDAKIGRRLRGITKRAEAIAAATETGQEPEGGSEPTRSEDASADDASAEESRPDAEHVAAPRDHP